MNAASIFCGNVKAMKWKVEPVVTQISNQTAVIILKKM